MRRRSSSQRDRPGGWQSLAERFQRIITTSLGLATLLIGVQMALKADSVLVVIASLVVGGVTGSGWTSRGAGADWRPVEVLGAFRLRNLRDRICHGQPGFLCGANDYCGVDPGRHGGTADLLYAKSLLDGAASVAFASGLGVGVSCAAVTVIVFQGALTLLGAKLAFLLLPDVLSELTARVAC